MRPRPAAVILAAGVLGCGHSAPGPIPAAGLRGGVALSADDGDMWIADLRGGHRRRVVHAPGPQEDPSLWVVRPDGSGSRPLPLPLSGAPADWRAR